MHEDVLNPLPFEIPDSKTISIGRIDDKVAIDENGPDMGTVEVPPVDPCGRNIGTLSLVRRVNPGS